MNIQANDYPFAQELITDAEGHVHGVVIDLKDYQKLIEALEDEGLNGAINEVRSEVPLSLDEALVELQKE